MKHLVPATGMLGLVGNVKAHDVDMPPLVHLAEHGWLLMTAIALVFIFLPLFRRRS